MSPAPQPPYLIQSPPRPRHWRPAILLAQPPLGSRHPRHHRSIDLTKPGRTRVHPSMQIAGGWRTQFVALSAIWGSSFLFIKVLDRHWAPTWVALGRVAPGTATLVVLLYARGERLRVPRAAWPHILIAALFLNAIPFTLFA